MNSLVSPLSLSYMHTHSYILAHWPLQTLRDESESWNPSPSVGVGAWGGAGVYRHRSEGGMFLLGRTVSKSQSARQTIQRPLFLRRKSNFFLSDIHVLVSRE